MNLALRPTSTSTCPLCRSAVLRCEGVECSECLAVAHEACVHELGGCHLALEATSAEARATRFAGHARSLWLVTLSAALSALAAGAFATLAGGSPKEGALFASSAGTLVFSLGRIVVSLSSGLAECMGDDADFVERAQEPWRYAANVSWWLLFTLAPLLYLHRVFLG